MLPKRIQHVTVIYCNMHVHWSSNGKKVPFLIREHMHRLGERYRVLSSVTSCIQGMLYLDLGSHCHPAICPHGAGVGCRLGYLYSISATQVASFMMSIDYHV